MSLTWNSSPVRRSIRCLNPHNGQLVITLAVVKVLLAIYGCAHSQ